MAEQDIPPPTITAIKIPIIRKEEYDIWSMRMLQYIYHTDHNLWDVIVNRDLVEEPTPTGETSAPPASKTAKQLAAKSNQERVKSILLLAIHDEYLLKFRNVADAKSLWEAIKSRFGGNEESKKMHKNVHGAPISKEDIYQKFLRSLPASWNQIALIMRNKSDIDEIDIDDFYNNLRVYKDEIKRSGRNQGKRSYGDNGRSNAPTNESSSQALVAQDGLGGYDWSNDFEIEPVNYALMAISSSSSLSSSDNEVQKCSKQCLESFKTLQKNYDGEREKHSRARLEIQGYVLALESLESRILVHEKNELAWEKVVKERDEFKLKIEKWEESSKNLDELLNSQTSARNKTGLGYGTQLNEMSNNSKTNSEISLSVFYVSSSDEESTPANDRFSNADGYHAVPPPITGKFLTPRADISFAGKTNEANTQKPKTVYESVNRDKVIIEDWNSDDKDDVFEVQTVSPVNTNETQTSQESKMKTMVNTGPSVDKPVWDNTKRVNHQKISKYPHLRKNFVPTGVLTRTGLITPIKQNEKRAVHKVSTARPVSTTRPVSTVRPFAPKIAQTSGAMVRISRKG
ncbi:hypothetical protein Tco_1553554 [Tanacetum coccineum]